MWKKMLFALIVCSLTAGSVCAQKRVAIQAYDSKFLSVQPGVPLTAPPNLGFLLTVVDKPTAGPSETFFMTDFGSSPIGNKYVRFKASNNRDVEANGTVSGFPVGVLDTFAINTAVPPIVTVGALPLDPRVFEVVPVGGDWVHLRVRTRAAVIVPGTAPPVSLSPSLVWTDSTPITFPPGPAVKAFDPILRTDQVNNPNPEFYKFKIIALDPELASCNTACFWHCCGGVTTVEKLNPRRVPPLAQPKTGVIYFSGR